MTTDRSVVHGERERERERVCAGCGEARVRTEEVGHAFPFGAGEDAVQLTAPVPLRVCESCGFEYLDHEAEERQHDAACRHLGLLTPTEIFEVREALGVDRADFAALTGLRESMIGRWESGAGYQTVAEDRLIRSLIRSVE